MSDDTKESNSVENVPGEIIQGHEYDGIQELDNPLPRWWLVTFYGTIVFSIFYYGYYELFGGPSHDALFQSEMMIIEERQPALTDVSSEDFDSLDVNSLLADSESMLAAKDHFLTKCAACHGQNGEGLVGPNLTDKYWIHSKGGIAAIVEAIRVGYPEKGMPPWGELIPPELHVYISAYVLNLPAAEGKPPQGDLIE